MQQIDLASLEVPMRESHNLSIAVDLQIAVLSYFYKAVEIELTHERGESTVVEVFWEVFLFSDSTGGHHIIVDQARKTSSTEVSK